MFYVEEVSYNKNSLFSVIALQDFSVLSYMNDLKIETTTLTKPFYLYKF